MEEKGIQIIWRMCALFVLLFVVVTYGVYVAFKTDIITFESVSNYLSTPALSSEE